MTTLRSDIHKYITGDGYISAHRTSKHPNYGFNDRLLYTAEYYILLKLRNPVCQPQVRETEWQPHDAAEFQYLIERATNSEGYLVRGVCHNPTPCDADDYLAVIAAYSILGLTPQFKLPLKFCFIPHLLYAYLLTRGIPSWVMFPLAWWNAFYVIVADNDQRHRPEDRKSIWLLWNATLLHSLLATFTAAYWCMAQSRRYNSDNPMREIAKLCYPEHHPFTRYFIT